MANVYTRYWRQWQQNHADHLFKIPERQNDKRWRMEHAQVINRDDFHYFGDNNIIPSITTHHATSDMYWAGQQLGLVRVKGA